MKVIKHLVILKHFFHNIMHHFKGQKQLNWPTVYYILQGLSCNVVQAFCNSDLQFVQKRSILLKRFNSLLYGTFYFVILNLKEQLF